MKILLVNTRHFYGGGDSTYAFNLAELLSNRSHEIAFFAMQDERNILEAHYQSLMDVYSPACMAIIE